MNRIAVHVAAAGLAVGVTISELAAIALLAEAASFAGDSIVVLPRIVIEASATRAAAPCEADPAAAIVATATPKRPDFGGGATGC